EIMIRTVYYPANLLLRSHISHNGEYLSGEHHSHLIGEKSFYRLSMVIIIAVKPSFIRFTVDPFMILQIFREPVCFVFQIFCQFGQPDGKASAADSMTAALHILCQQIFFCLDVLK